MKKNILISSMMIIFSIIILQNCNPLNMIAEDFSYTNDTSKKSFKQEGQLNAEPIKLEAYFMQYACGDWNDDMRIISVQDTTYSFLLEKDIDPLLFKGESEIRGWLYDNKTEEYRMKFHLEGYVSKCAKSGCEGKTPKFWITHIEKLDGSEFKMERGSN